MSNAQKINQVGVNTSNLEKRIETLKANIKEVSQTITLEESKRAAELVGTIFEIINDKEKMQAFEVKHGSFMELSERAVLFSNTESLKKAEESLAESHRYFSILSAYYTYSSEHSGFMSPVGFHQEKDNVFYSKGEVQFWTSKPSAEQIPAGHGLAKIPAGHALAAFI